MIIFKKVKGEIFKRLVIIIRANKTGAYDNLLTDKDKEIISQRILPSIWYPFDTYKNCLNAVAHIEGKDNMELIQMWGKKEGETVFTNVYKAFIVRAEPFVALEKFKNFRRLMYDFGEFLIEGLSDSEANIINRGIDQDFKVYYNILLGWLERFLELCTNKKFVSKFLAKSWEGAPETIVNVSWSN
ncbi:MAG: hypothetical protein ACFFAS_21365 [Promethearchaeota archaeon]